MSFDDADGAGAQEPDLTEREEELLWAANIIAGTMPRGEIVGIQGLTFERRAVGGNQWSLYDEDDNLVDVIDARKCKSARAFLQYVEKTLGEDETRWAPP